MKLFISGSLSIKEIPLEALKVIDEAIQNNDIILVGDAIGVDSLVQEYLVSKNYPNVIVHHSGKVIRNIKDYSWKTQETVNTEEGMITFREFYTLKDITMSNECDYGLAIWDGKSKGTKRNINHLQRLHKQTYIIDNER